MHRATDPLRGDIAIRQGIADFQWERLAGPCKKKRAWILHLVNQWSGRRNLNLRLCSSRRILVSADATPRACGVVNKDTQLNVTMYN
jgi:hypothetical protein